LAASDVAPLPPRADLLEDVPAAALAIACGVCLDDGDSGNFIEDGPDPARVVSDGFFDQENIFDPGIFQPLLLLQPVNKKAPDTNPKAANRVHLVTSNRILDHSLDLKYQSFEGRRHLQ
jgi:hypothetical protein